MVVDGTLKPATEPLQGLVSSQNLGSTQTCFGAHQIVLVTVEGATYLCDVGAGPKCLVEPVLLRAYDDTDDQGPSRQQPPQDWLAAGGESQQAGMRYRIRRGIMGSAQPLSTAAALVHPERESFVGYYLQVCAAYCSKSMMCWLIFSLEEVGKAGLCFWAQRATQRSLKSVAHSSSCNNCSCVCCAIMAHNMMMCSKAAALHCALSCSCIQSDVSVL